MVRCEKRSVKTQVGFSGKEKHCIICLDLFHFKILGLKVILPGSFPYSICKHESFSYVRNPVDIPLHPIVDRRQFTSFNGNTRRLLHSLASLFLVLTDSLNIS